MPNQTVNYKCPSCNGTMHYDADAGKMKCDFCGSTFTAAELEALYAEQQKKADAAAAEADQRAAAGEVSAYEQMGNIAGEGTRTVAESLPRPCELEREGARGPAHLHLLELRRRAHGGCGD